MRRKARVIGAGVVSVPNRDRYQAVQVVTDFPEAGERAFYLRLSSPMPVLGSTIEWGDDRAWYDDDRSNPVIAHKVDYNFDPERPLR